MRIHDNGVSFQAHPILLGSGTKRLSFLGVRERVDMISRLDLEAALGQGATITAHIPSDHGLTARAAGGSRKARARTKPLTS